MSSEPPQSSPKTPTPTRFIKAMGQGLHEHFDKPAEEEAPSDMLRSLKQADRRHLFDPKDKH